MIAAPVVSSKPSTKAPRDPLGTINRIFAAAREEFGANGFDGAKVEHIARRAKVSKQLVYLYFNGKDELYSELLKVMTKASYTRLLTIDFTSLEPDAAVQTYRSEEHTSELQSLMRISYAVF